MFTLASKDGITVCSVKNNRRFFSRSYIISNSSSERVKRMEFVTQWYDNIFGIVSRYKMQEIDPPHIRAQRAT